MKKIICNYSSLSMDTTTFMVCLFAEVGISLKNIGSKFDKILHACSAAELINFWELGLDQWITVTDVTIIEIEIVFLTEHRIESKLYFSCIPSNDLSIEA